MVTSKLQSGLWFNTLDGFTVVKKGSASLRAILSCSLTGHPRLACFRCKFLQQHLSLTTTIKNKTSVPNVLRPPGKLLPLVGQWGYSGGVYRYGYLI